MEGSLASGPGATVSLHRGSWSTPFRAPGTSVVPKDTERADRQALFTRILALYDEEVR